MDIDSAHPSPLLPRSLEVMHHPFTAIDMQFTDECSLVVAQSHIAGFWVLADVEEIDVDWQAWTSVIPDRLELANITTLRIHIQGTHNFWHTIFGPMIQLKELAVSLDKASLAPTARPPVVILRSVLSQEPLLCPALHTLNIEWPNAIKSDDLCVSDLTDMLVTRTRLGCPIHTLAVRAIAVIVDIGGQRVWGFGPMLAPLAALVQAFSSVSRLDEHVCTFEPSRIWSVEGAEEYWELDQCSRPHYSVP
ncbi:hypothetical protein BD309DRAFT_1004341 [Dichomitus squalens]|uniref:Uncharacterized protein n=1 Tax=Dichomitus squalens TaxID=114155 RepID=A0A4Q9NDY8_9APHY|nr:hypothetical protein BD309DRAFT_1004341 [Dichomitus squalens]TBU55015.1 hypothetical protein BD310DRAFT_826843 [Dichomitus squalens]